MTNSKLKKISNDLEFQRYQGGIKIYHPSKRYPSQTIGSLLALPMSFYLLDKDGKTKTMNEEGAEVTGFDSSKHSLGKSVIEVGVKESAELLIQHCHQVIDTNSLQFFEEQHIRKDGAELNFLSIKCPWYDENNKIQGTCGFSIVMGKHSTANSLSLIANLGLLNPSLSQEQKLVLPEHIKVQLTPREIECLKLTVKGYTAKRIAKELKISFRTVQEYITNTRIKLNVGSKAELIEMVMQ